MQLNQEDNTLFYNGYNYDEGSYCQSVLDASTLEKGDHYRLSDVNVIKLLHDHGADAKEWQQDSICYNDPLELLSWLGY